MAVAGLYLLGHISVILVNWTNSSARGRNKNKIITKTRTHKPGFSSVTDCHLSLTGVNTVKAKEQKSNTTMRYVDNLNGASLQRAII